MPASRYLKGSVFLLCLLWLSYARAQTTIPADTLVERLQKQNKRNNREKVHLNFDKPFYALGDTAWFAGYVVNALNNIPSERSHILHVDLIGPKNNLIKSFQLPVNVGFAAGNIPLADSLPGGTYHIRAYTNLMRNFEATPFFNKSIRIIDAFPKQVSAKVIAKQAIKIAEAATAIAVNYDIQFFPEGGQLVYGLKSAVAFKVVAPTGLGAAVTGSLIDEQGKTVLNFKTGYAGMGAFILTPGTGKNYTAIIKLPDGTEKRMTLPPALNSGYVLAADNSKPDSLYITLQATPDLINKGDLTFIPLSNGAPLFYMKTKFPDGQINITAPKNKLPGGILQLSLLNAQNQPVAERLVFNNYRVRVNLHIDQLKSVYAKRERAEFAMRALDATGQPAIGSFSMAVINADAVNADELSETTIFSNLLLSSELKGYIENPNYYFTDVSEQKNAELDHLMLTQGWRRYIWQDAAAVSLPNLAYPVEDKITVAGTIKGSAKSNHKNVPVTLLAGQLGSGALLDTVTDNEGRFVFHVADSLTDLPFRIQAKPKKPVDYEVNINRYLPPIISAEPADFTLTEISTDTINKENQAVANYGKTIAANAKHYGKNSMFDHNTRLKEVVVKDYKPKPKIPNSHSANLNGPGEADVVILPETLEKMPDLTTIDVLLPGTIVNPGNHVLWLRSIVGTHMPPVLILIDGADAGSDALFITPPQDIESIEFMKTPAYAGIYGIRGSGGVLLITTKKGGVDYGDITAKAPNSISFKLPLQLRKEFYAPQYDKAEQVKTMDLRTTVYWKPDIITDKNGKATVCFYNTNVAGNYRVVIEGLSAKGNLCRQVFSYKVE